MFFLMFFEKFSDIYKIFKMTGFFSIFHIRVTELDFALMCSSIATRRPTSMTSGDRSSAITEQGVEQACWGGDQFL